MDSASETESYLFFKSPLGSGRKTLLAPSLSLSFTWLSHEKDKDSEGARRVFRPDPKATMRQPQKCNAATSDRRDQIKHLIRKKKPNLLAKELEQRRVQLADEPAVRHIGH